VVSSIGISEYVCVVWNLICSLYVFVVLPRLGVVFV
jgi:hypothetical protein